MTNELENLKRRLLAYEGGLTKAKVEQIKREWSKEHTESKLPLSSEILALCSSEERSKLDVLVTKPTRTLSGVSVVAVMTAPFECPGTCTYCPSSELAPKSYVGYEPSAMRARLNEFDPYKIVKNRLEQLEAAGHSTEKNEVVVQGGTFPALTRDYKENFIKRIFDAFNGKDSKGLEEAKKINETAKHRIIGLTIETRPDWVDVDELLEFGATRVELGVQSVYDDVLEKVKRGHDVARTKKSVKELKDAGFKLCFHIMPGLPGSTFESDLKMFKMLFEDSDFKPDMLKIYPCLVVKGSELYSQWKSGKFKAAGADYMKDLLTQVYKMVPKWVRIMRIQRDIPSQYIEAGPIQSNLRELVEAHIKKSKEIRFREAGQVYRRKGIRPDKVEITVEEYKASGGKEYFIAAEDLENDILVGFLRFRIPVEPIRSEITKRTGIVRELHVYSTALPIDSSPTESSEQHKGWGSKLLAKAEEIAREAGMQDIVVISGVGVREYYRAKGYALKGAYMHKIL